jgi:hypothetical protein
VVWVGLLTMVVLKTDSEQNAKYNSGFVYIMVKYRQITECN